MQDTVAHKNNTLALESGVDVQVEQTKTEIIDFYFIYSYWFPI